MNKIIIAIICLAVILVALYVFSKLKQDEEEIVEETYNARVDIYNIGDRSNTIFVEKQIPSNMKFDKFDNPDWMSEPGIGTSFTFTPKKNWQDGEIVFKAIGSGKLIIEVLGAYRPINGNNDDLEKLYVDFKDVTINGEKLMEESKTVWHNDRATFTVHAENDKIYTLKFKYKNPS